MPAGEIRKHPTAQSGLAPAPTPTKSAWGGNKLSFKRPTPDRQSADQSHVAPTQSQTTTGLAGVHQQISNLAIHQSNVASSQPGSWNPSVAPAPRVPASKFTNFPRGGLSTNAPTRYTIQYGRSNPKKWFQNQVCIRSPYTREEFRNGQVIAVPFHVSNMNPRAKPTDEALTLTNLGPVLSKRRMLVILHIHLEGFFCLPLYSFGGRGLDAKRGAKEIEYIPVMDEVHKSSYENSSSHYEPLIHKHDNPNISLLESTVCHLTGGVKISWQEHVTTVGRLTQASFKELVKHYNALNLTAQQAPWKP